MIRQSNCVLRNGPNADPQLSRQGGSHSFLQHFNIRHLTAIHPMGAYMSSGLISAGELMRLLNLGFVSHVHPANQGLYCTFVVSLFPMTPSANHCYFREKVLPVTHIAEFSSHNRLELSIHSKPAGASQSWYSKRTHISPSVPLLSHHLDSTNGAIFGVVR